MSDKADTIAAIATPRGNGGVGIIRVSGPGVAALLQSIHPAPLPPRTAVLTRISDEQGRLIDEVLLLHFPAPASFTGEDVLELQGHGGLVVMDMLLEHLLKQGCRQARPGEFSERAFLNDKMDLVQAEAIADLIESQSRTAARGAMRSLQGEFSRRVSSLVDELIALRIQLEAYLDFPDEEIDTIPTNRFADLMVSINTKLGDLLQNAQQGHILRDGLHLVLAGKPNAGKSSLLNRLTATDSAIVSDIPGTTRDVIRERIHIDGIPLDVTDTAGLRSTGDVIESQGVERARREIGVADRILLIIDDMEYSDEVLDEMAEFLHAETPVTVVRNKIDTTNQPCNIEERSGVTTVALSARTGEGIPLLLQHLKKACGVETLPEGVFTARQRHLDALRRARSAIDRAGGQLEPEPRLELLAEDLRQAQSALNDITGEFSSDDLLGEIFGSFCIGK